MKAIERQEQSPISPEEQGEAQRSARAVRRSVLILGLLALLALTAKLNETPAKFWDYFYLNV